MHATAISIQGSGVLLTGPSGSGKSDLALRLIDRGAALVSDDYTLLTPSNGALLAAPPETIAGKIEVRGLGIFELPFVVDVPVVLVVRLGQTVERMPLVRVETTVAGIAFPEIAVPAFEVSSAIKVELALGRATMRA